jgi:hypothetical protein
MRSLTRLALALTLSAAGGFFRLERLRAIQLDAALVIGVLGAVLAALV